jgi:uncharacterized protein (TIGR02246 family)
MSDRAGETVPVPAPEPGPERVMPLPELEWVEPGELEPADDPVGDAIRALNVRYAAALAAADANALCELFTPDGAIIDFEGPDAMGHDALREMAHYARERFRDVSFEIDVEWVKADPRDSAVAYAAGTWRMAFVARNGHAAGGMLRSHGRFAETWHRGADGRWRLHRDLTLTREDG